jgi:hypothetical protein
VTDGPIIELELGGARPGDEAVTPEDPLRGHLRVRAAPWVDVSHIEVVVGVVGAPTATAAAVAGAGAGAGGPPGPRVVQTFDVPSRPTQLGPEPGSLQEAQARTVRFDQDIEVPVGPDNGWVQVIVRGERRMDDVLPFMPAAPLGFTNPVYVVRHPQSPPPFPAVGSPAPVRPPP